jgi:hypothetical protein
MPLDPEPLAGMLDRTAASFAVSSVVLSLTFAFCVRARDIGEGGRGGGFIFCASTREIVALL